MTTRTRKILTKMKTNRLAAATVATLVIMALSFSATTLFAGDKKLDPRQPYALIFGTVYGPDNHPLRGVKVKIRREGEKKTVEVWSDNRGEFAHRFPAGKVDYLVWADIKDRQAAQKTEVKVHVENDERQDITLHLSK